MRVWKSRSISLGLRLCQKECSDVYGWSWRDLLRLVFLQESTGQFEVILILNELEEKYGDLFEFDRINGIQSGNVLFWGQVPSQLFTEVQSGRRHPLIINESSQLDLMRPTPGSPETDSKEVWNPSYGSFTIQLIEYPEELRTQLIVPMN